MNTIFSKCAGIEAGNLGLIEKIRVQFLLDTIFKQT